MSVILAAVIQLAGDVHRPRRRGWRCVCEFDEIVSSDGGRLVGVEIAPAHGEEVLPGEETEVRLRLWAPLSRVPRPRTGVRFYEGERLVASGTTGASLEDDDNA